MEARNQTFLRMNNKRDMIALLREQSRSYSDIARALRLSNTAVAKIADDLIAKGLIRRENETKGRMGITLSVNAEFGYIFAIDLSGRNIELCAADFKGQILLRKEIAEIVSFAQSDLGKLIEGMREMAASELLKDRKLCCISVATPGKLKETGEFLLNPRFKGFENISIGGVLHEAFGCDVVVKNDVNLALSGEKTCGNVLREAQNALMLHIDVGMGAAVLINGTVYEGSHGFAGEIGFFKLDMRSTEVDAFENLSYANIYDSVSLYSSLSILRRELHSGATGYLKVYCDRQGLRPDEISIRAMIEAYRAGDPLARRVLNSSAQIIGTVAANLAELLDVEIVVLNGAVVELGEPFLKVISSYVKGRPVKYSSLRNATLMGAIDVGLRQSFANHF